jgi:hypothetical protein
LGSDCEKSTEYGSELQGLRRSRPFHSFPPATPPPSKPPPLVTDLFSDHESERTSEWSSEAGSVRRHSRRNRRHGTMDTDFDNFVPRLSRIHDVPMDNDETDTAFEDIEDRVRSHKPAWTYKPFQKPPNGSTNA